MSREGAGGPRHPGFAQGLMLLLPISMAVMGISVAGGDESITDPSRVPHGAGMFHRITFAP